MTACLADWLTNIELGVSRAFRWAAIADAVIFGSRGLIDCPKYKHAVGIFVYHLTPSAERPNIPYLPQLSDASSSAWSSQLYDPT